jgi:putative tryptophan/tyrosine transport system substrate-binding protein
VRRREFISLIGGAAAWPLAAGAQQPTIPTIGFLNSASAEGYGARVIAFKKGLQETGYTEGQNIRIEYRWAEGHFDRLPAMATDLVQRKVAVIAAGGSPNPALAAKAATKTIPIVFTNGGDPIADGLVTNLSRPGGTITGAIFFSNVFLPRRLGLLRELLPDAGLIAVLINPNNTSTTGVKNELERSARESGRPIIIVEASNEREIDSAVAGIVEQRASAVLVDADGLFRSHADQLIALAARYSLPASYADREYVVAGGLMSYGPSIADGYRQCGTYVGQILKGTNAGDLPVLQPTKFEFALNLKTAKTLGVDVPMIIQMTADEVIE